MNKENELYKNLAKQIIDDTSYPEEVKDNLKTIIDVYDNPKDMFEASYLYLKRLNLINF